MISEEAFLESIPFMSESTLKQAQDKIKIRLRYLSANRMEIQKEYKQMTDRIQNGLTPNYISKLRKP